MQYACHLGRADCLTRLDQALCSVKFFVQPVALLAWAAVYFDPVGRRKCSAAACQRKVTPRLQFVKFAYVDPDYLLEKSPNLSAQFVSRYL